MRIRSLDQVIRALMRVHSRPAFGRFRCNLLIGAGCSVSAGIKGAQEIGELILKQVGASGKVDRIRKELEVHLVNAAIALREARGAVERDNCRAILEILAILKDSKYSIAMEAMPSAMRRRFIERITKFKAGTDERILPNDAHRAIAGLMSMGFVDRVLTTNFDTLLEDELQRFGQQGLEGSWLDEVQVIDALDSRTNRPTGDSPCVVYLHGKQKGILQGHTPEDFARHANQIGRHFRNATEQGIWLVIGYSGSADIVLDMLCRQTPQDFEDGLYWFPYREEMPASRVTAHLLESFLGTYLVRGCTANHVGAAATASNLPTSSAFPGDADSFLVTMFETLRKYWLVTSGRTKQIWTKRGQSIQWTSPSEFDQWSWKSVSAEAYNGWFEQHYPSDDAFRKLVTEIQSEILTRRPPR